MLAATAGSVASSLRSLRFGGQVLNQSLHYAKDKPWLVGASWSLLLASRRLSSFPAGRGCRQRCRVNALTLPPACPGLVLRAVCDGRGALPCSPSWCGSWPRRAEPSCSPCWGSVDAEGSRKAKPCAPLRRRWGLANPRWRQGCELGLAWLCKGLCSAAVLSPASRQRVACTGEAAFPGQRFGLQSQAVLCCSLLALGLMC